MNSSAGAAWAGIDLGTQSVRAVVVGDEGERLAEAAVPLTSRREDGRHEQDPTKWLSATWAALRDVTGRLPAGVAVRALAVSGTSGTLVPLDPSGRPLGAAIMYDDRRGAGARAEVQAAGESVWDRLGYRMQATWALPKLVTLLRSGDHPDAVWGHQPDVVTSALAGRLLPSDTSSALKTGADLDAVAWPQQVLAALRIPIGALNALAESGAVIGEVGPVAAAETGLPAGCAIVAGMTDGCAAQLSAGALARGTWNSVLGTTLVLKGAVAERRADFTGAVYAHRAPFGGGWYPGGASSVGAGSVSALLPGRDLAALTVQAAARDGVPIAYPLTGTGERFPFVADTAQGFGVPDGDDAAVLGAIAWGVAFTERLAFDLLGLLGYPADRVLLTGGGSRNPWWNGVRAGLLDRPVALPAAAEGAAGMALLAAAAIGGGSDPLAVAAERLIGPAVPVDPIRADGAADAYGGFLDELERREWLDPRLATAAREGIG